MKHRLKDSSPTAEPKTARQKAPGPEQRRHPRAQLRIPVTWGHTPDCPHEGHVTSLSVGGCFIETKAQARAGEVVFVHLELSDQIEGVTACSALYRVTRTGIGVAFYGLPDEAREDLRDLVAVHLGPDANIG